MGIAPLALRRFGTLSDGEQKRTLVARALFPTRNCSCSTSPRQGWIWDRARAWSSGLGRLAADPAAPVQVMITHHVEEIPPGYTHALLMREGRRVAAGPDRRGPDRRQPEQDVRRPVVGAARLQPVLGVRHLTGRVASGDTT